MEQRHGPMHRSGQRACEWPARSLGPASSLNSQALIGVKARTLAASQPRPVSPCSSSLLVITETLTHKHGLSDKELVTYGDYT